jgi:hypothetical protein
MLVLGVVPVGLQVFHWVDRALEYAEHVDYVRHHLDDIKTWWATIPDIPEWANGLILAGGLAFIWWDLRRTRRSPGPIATLPPAVVAQPPTNKPSAQSKRYFAYDIEARLKAIDHLDGILARFAPLIDKGQNDLLNNINAYIRDGWAADKLLQFAYDAKKVLDDLNSAVDGYQSRFPDIARTISLYPQSHLAISLYSSSINLRDEILQWAGRDQMLQHVERSRAMLEWRQSLAALPQYVNYARNELALKRREYEAAEVHGAETK